MCSTSWKGPVPTICVDRSISPLSTSAPGTIETDVPVSEARNGAYGSERVAVISYGPVTSMVKPTSGPATGVPSATAVASAGSTWWGGPILVSHHASG